MNQDLATIGELLHPDFVISYPQSGETFRDRDNYLEMLGNYPGGLASLEISDTHGAKDEVQVIPSPFGLPTITVTGAGDTFFYEGTAQYADGAVFQVVGIVEISEGKVARDTSYFCEPFEPPAWRTPYVDR